MRYSSTLLLLSSMVGYWAIDSMTQPDRNASVVQAKSIGTMANSTYSGGAVYGMRKFPYPYQAMLAISSDADHETLRKFNLIHEFINTTEMTPMGKGLGLDFSDSFFMYNGSNKLEPVDYQDAPKSDQLSYFNGVSDEPTAADVLNRYIHVGWVDTMHTFGDFTMTNSHRTEFTQALAVQAIDALEANHDNLTVWTDHGNTSNVDNFGSYGRAKFFWYQEGANPWSTYHITNLLIPYGIHFMWADQTCDKFGLDSIIYPKTLPDGEKIWGFWRYTNYGYTRQGDPLWSWSVKDLAGQLTMQHLLRIEELHQYSIVAQHLEELNTQDPLPKSTVNALELLATQYHDGNILVARTSRLLQYNVTQKYLRYHVTHEHGDAMIDITSIADPVFGTHTPTLDEVRGVTFYCSNPAQTMIEIDHTPVPANLIQRNASDGFRPSIEIKWFPVDTHNYAEDSTVLGVTSIPASVQTKPGDNPTHSG